jgi:hypothetical protein
MNNSSLYAYYLSAESYSETVFTENISTITPNLYLYNKETSNISKYEQVLKLDFAHGCSYTQTLIDSNNNVYELQYICNHETITTFDGMTNGTF